MSGYPVFQFVDLDIRIRIYASFAKRGLGLAPIVLATDDIKVTKMKLNESDTTLFG